MRMRAVAVLLVALGVTLVTPPGVGAAGRQYAGAFESGGRHGFTVVDGQRGQRLSRYGWSGLPIGCEGGPRVTGGSVGGRMPVVDGRFKVVATASNFKESKLTLRGVLKGSMTAEGTIRIRGTKVPVTGGGFANCDSGKVAWTAAALPLRSDQMLARGHLWRD